MVENSGTTPAGSLDAPTAALAAAVLDVVRHVDGEELSTPRWFALLPSGALLRQQPSFAALLDPATIEAAQGDPLHLTPLELDDVPASADLAATLEGLAWPDIATGGAVAVDLAGITWSEDSATAVADRLGSGTPRAVVAVLADGLTWCAVRGQGRKDLVLGPRVVPELVDVLAASLGVEGGTEG